MCLALMDCCLPCLLPVVALLVNLDIDWLLRPGVFAQLARGVPRYYRNVIVSANNSLVEVVAVLAAVIVVAVSALLHLVLLALSLSLMYRVRTWP